MQTSPHHREEGSPLLTEYQIDGVSSFTLISILIILGIFAM